MGVTLGINDDYWHFILTYFATIVTETLIVCFVQDPIILRLLIVMYHFLIAFVQFFYEWHQAMDPDVERKYTTWQNFQRNSRRDIRFFLLGLFLGDLTSLALYGLFVS